MVLVAIYSHDKQKKNKIFDKQNINMSINETDGYVLLTDYNVVVRRW